MRKYLYSATAIVAAVAMFSFLSSSERESVEVQLATDTDVSVQSPTVEDNLMAEIAEALKERIEVVLPQQADQSSLQLDLGQLPESDALQRLPSAAQACLLDLQHCSEVFPGEPEPCLLALDRCGGVPEVILLGSATR